MGAQAQTALNSTRKQRGRHKPTPRTAKDKKSKRLEQETRRGRNLLERPYKHPAAKLAKCAREKAGGEGKTRPSQELKHRTIRRTRGVNQKGNLTELVERTDLLE